MVDARRVARDTGWVVEAHERVASTNDLAARRRDDGAPARTVVVADAQSAGRGRGGRTFSSPAGGLYASLLLRAEPRDLPGPLTACVAVAAAEAVESVAGVPVALKWPNDLWIRGRKAAGILLESAGVARPVIAGIGVNVRGVPEDLPEAARAEATCLDGEAGRPVDLADLLVALLRRVDARLPDLATPAGRLALEADWRGRLLWVGERVRYGFDGRTWHATLRDVRLEGGLRLEDDEAGEVLRRPEHVYDLRPE